MVIAKVIAKQPLQHMTLFEGIFRKRTEIERERERERKRASELDAKWYGTVTAGNRAPQVEFASSVLPLGWMCTTVFPWFTPSSMDCVWSHVIAFGGPYCFTVFRTHLWQKTPAILKWSSTIMTVTHVCIYIYQTICDQLWSIRVFVGTCIWKETWSTIITIRIFIQESW